MNTSLITWRWKTWKDLVLTQSTEFYVVDLGWSYFLISEFPVSVLMICFVVVLALSFNSTFMDGFSLIWVVFADMRPCLGTSSPWMGCELRCGICSQRRRCVHCDCSEDQEDDPFWWAFCEEQLQNQWARQGCSHYRQPNEQEEETSLQIQNQELFRFHISCRSHHKDCRVNEKCWVGFFSFFFV